MINRIKCFLFGHDINIKLFHNSMFVMQCEDCSKKDFNIKIYDNSSSKIFSEKIDFKSFITQKEWDSNNSGVL